MASDAEVITGTSQTKFVNPKQANHNYSLAVTSASYSTVFASSPYETTGILFSN
jgi:hypothetical protein